MGALEAGGAMQLAPFAEMVGIAASCILCMGAMAAIVVFDCAVRLIPRFLCRVLGGAGALLQFLLHGAAGLAAGALCLGAVAVSVVVVPWLIGRFVKRSGQQIGGGDIHCMAALCLATGAGAPAGLMACFVSAVAWSISARLRKRLLPKEPFAFAPFLAIWLVVGVLAST